MAEEVVNAKHLRRDTALLNQYVRSCNEESKKKDGIIAKHEAAIKIDTTVRNTYKEKASTFSEKLEKVKSNNKKLVKVILGIGSVAILEGVLIVAIIKGI